jgi:hypothetical protein
MPIERATDDLPCGVFGGLFLFSPSSQAGKNFYEDAVIRDLAHSQNKARAMYGAGVPTAQGRINVVYVAYGQAGSTEDLRRERPAVGSDFTP